MIKCTKRYINEAINYMSKVSYSSTVGSFIYGMVCIRTDLSHSASVVSMYMTNPGKEHQRVGQQTFRYLRGTTNICLQFGKAIDSLISFVDSDFAGDLDKRRSLIKYIFTLGGCAISWKATLQATIALSTTKVEYMAITEASKETIWLQGLF